MRLPSYQGERLTWSHWKGNDGNSKTMKQGKQLQERKEAEAQPLKAGERCMVCFYWAKPKTHRVSWDFIISWVCHHHERWDKDGHRHPFGSKSCVYSQTVVPQVLWEFKFMFKHSCISWHFFYNSRIMIFLIWNSVTFDLNYFLTPNTDTILVRTSSFGFVGRGGKDDIAVLPLLCSLWFKELEKI